MRMPMIAGNWKMNTTVDEAVVLVTSMLSPLDEIKGIEKVVCPPFVSLTAVKKVIKKSSIKLGAQNLFFETKGAYTGEISPLMLSGLCDYVIIGHSERRHYFGETQETVDKKINAAVQEGLLPIFCVGETLEENEAGKTDDVLKGQLMASSRVNYYLGGMVIAYEPVWAIGTGRSATSEQANRTIGFIRKFIGNQHGIKIAENVRILYGGSVTTENIAGLMREPEIDGALVGGASLKADDFLNIVRQTAEIRGLA
jgi:triosephosphate isomerase